MSRRNAYLPPASYNTHMKTKTIHLIPNAHLDPVYLWDWREGFNESLATFQVMVELMERYPELTFVHGEANSYEPVEQYAPALFEKIRTLVAAGRWDLVGGNYVQTDDNFPSTTTFVHQFRRGQEYFKNKFGKEVTASWSPDSAGHAAGFPEIYAAAGLRYFSFTRPPEFVLHLENPAFVWQGASGAEVLTYRAFPAYVSERDTTGKSLEQTLAQFDVYPQKTFMFCVGMGDHGGGTSVRQIEELRDCIKRHPEYDIKFSTLHAFFEELDEERHLLPTRKGEINFTLRGVHTANAKIKHKFRDAEATVKRAAQTCAVVNRALGLAPVPFAAEWDAVLFNAFHDILPGDGIDRANREQVVWMDSAIHSAEQKEFASLNAFIQRLRVEVPPAYADDAPSQVPFVFFNGCPVAFHGVVELEGTLDYRPLFNYAGREDDVPYDIRDERQQSIPYQQICPETSCGDNPIPWRKRVVFELAIPPFGHRLVYFGMTEKKPTPPPASAVGAPDESTITNGIYTVTLTNDRIGISKNGQPVFNQNGLEFASYRDRYGCWGAMDDAEESWTCREKLETWKITRTKVLESGPERAKIFALMEGGKSVLYLTISLRRGVDAVEFEATLAWGDSGTRLRLVFDRAHQVTYQVPGGEITRNVIGDVPGGRWLEGKLECGTMGLASDHFSGFSALEELFSVNMLRGSLSSTDRRDAEQAHPDRPPTDLGDHRFKWALTATAGLARQLAEQIECPPRAIQAWRHAGEAMALAFEVSPPCVKMLDVVHRADGLCLVLQNCSDHPVEARIDGVPLAMEPWKIIPFKR